MVYSKPLLPALFAAVIGAGLAGGCAGGSAAPPAEDAPPVNALAAMLGRPLVILPTQFLAFSTGNGSWESSPDNGALLELLDKEIEATLRRRGVQARWTFASEMVASARRNAGLIGDPHGLSAERYRRAKAGDTPLSEPLGSQIRTLVALRDARYALLPVEVRVEGKNGQGKGSVRLLLIDTRTARIVWAEDVIGAPTVSFGYPRAALTTALFPELARELASRIADMVVTQ